MKFKTGDYVTIIKDKLNHHFYTSKINKTFRVVEVAEGRVVRGYKWRRARLFGISYGDSETNAIYLKLKLKNHLYKENRPQFNKYGWWEIDEIRKATPEETIKAKEYEFAEAI